MSALSVALEHAVREARRLKEAHVRTTHDSAPGAADISPVIQGWRGSQPVVVLAPARVNRDDALHAARLAAVGFGCDLLSFTVDAWQRAYGAGMPSTGNARGQGARRRSSKDERPPGVGQAPEVLTTLVVNRAGDVRGALLPYRIDRKLSSLGITSYELAWQEEPALARNVRWDGLIVDYLVEFMNEPSVDAVMGRHGIPLAESFGLSGEEARAHMDCAALKILRSSGFDGEATLLANSAARASVIERSLSGYHGYGSMRGPT